MKLTTKSRYGLRAILQIAENQPKPITIQALADTQHVSKKYLHIILTKLKDKKIIRAIKGPGGGYTLLKDPSEITPLEVIEAVNDKICLVKCVAPNATCNNRDACKTEQIWVDLNETIRNKLAEKSLSDILSSSTK